MSAVGSKRTFHLHLPFAFNPFLPYLVRPSIGLIIPDPAFGVFGSAKKMRGIDAEKALIK